ncbi:hypothetical protein WAI453_005966 [Rhynchosporium graminicola]
MVESQQRCYLPAPKVLGWHVGLWSLIGDIGITLCGALGFAASNSGCVYQGSLATSGARGVSSSGASFSGTRVLIGILLMWRMARRQSRRRSPCEPYRIHVWIAEATFLIVVPESPSVVLWGRSHIGRR